MWMRAVVLEAVVVVAVLLIELLEPRALLAAPAVFESRGPGGGGAFFAPSFSPYSNAELYVASDMSGVYHSTNTGASWQIQDFRQTQGGRLSRVQFSSDPQVLFNTDFTGDSGAVTKSSDGGATWHRLNALSDVRGVIADPNSTTRLIAWDYGTLYFSSNGGASFAAKYANPDAGPGTRVAGAFFDGSTIYVGTNAGLIVSTDNGATFTPSAIGGLPSGKAIFSFAGAKQGGVVRLYASVMNYGDVFNDMFIEGVGTSSFAGIYSLDPLAGTPAWVSRAANIPAGQYPWFVSAPRGDIGIVYGAGRSDAGAPGIIKSTSAGANWTSVLNTSNNQNVATGWQGAGGDSGWGFGELAMDFQVSPTNANELAWTDFGYVHLSSDGGATWRQGYVNPADQNPAGAATPKHKPYRGVGLEDTTAHWITWTSPTSLFAAYTDITGVRSTDAGGSWSFPTYNPRQNTLYQVSSAANGTLYAASSTIHDMYQSTYLTDARIDGGSGRVLYSTDAGVTWNTLHDFSHPVVYTAIDPTNPNRMYASVVHSTLGGIFVTSDLNNGVNATWTKVTNPPRTQGHPFAIRVLNDGTLVVTYSGRRAPNFTTSSGVFVSTDHGTSWQDRTDAGMLYYTKEITIDPNDAGQNTWYASVRSGWSGFGNDLGGLYKTTNRGQSWTRIYTTEGVESLTIAPTTGQMYLATLSAGLLYSDGGANPTFASVTGYPFRQPERVFINPNDSGDIWVASFGFGIAEGKVDAVAPKVSSAVFNFGGATPSLDFGFSEDVSASLGTNDLTVIDSSGNSFGASSVTPGGSFVFGSGLPSGRYHTTLLASGVFDGAQNHLAANYAFDFVFVNAGQTLALPLDGGTFTVQQIAIGSGATLDVRNDTLVVNYASAPSPAGTWNGSAYTGLTGQIATGRIISSSANGQTTLGVAELAANAVTIKYTYAGDANLDGKLNIDDYVRIDTGIASGLTGWFNGDFNYDGKINIDDYVIIDSNLAAQGPPL